MRPFRTVPILFATLLTFAACGDESGPDAGAPGTPVIVVTTNILGDVVKEMVGDEAEVVIVMPVGADPHSFQASAQQAAAMRDADLLVVNGAGFEEGLDDVIHGAEEDGVPVIEAIADIDALSAEGSIGKGRVDHEGAASGDDHAEGGDEHGPSGVDPHFFTDPKRMARAVEAIAAAIFEEIDTVDRTEVEERVASYLAELEALDEDIASDLGSLPAERRVLVTDHEVFGYFADRYDFEIVGTVVPSGSTGEGASAGELAALADIMRGRGIRAIFSGESSTTKLADALATEVGDEVVVVELYSESLGGIDSEGATYLDMMRTNGRRIGKALR